jgi:transposase-like protein
MFAHPNAPLTPEGRQRLCERIDAGRPLAHVADEGGVSRTALTKWYKRWLAHGEAGLLDRTSRPERQPTRTPDDIEEMVIQLRVAEKWVPTGSPDTWPRSATGRSPSRPRPYTAS